MNLGGVGPSISGEMWTLDWPSIGFGPQPSVPLPFGVVVHIVGTYPMEAPGTYTFCHYRWDPDLHKRVPLAWGPYIV